MCKMSKVNHNKKRQIQCKIKKAGIRVMKISSKLKMFQNYTLLMKN